MTDGRKTGSGRLFCLDLLRGLDMMLLLVVGPLVMSYGKAWGLPAEVLGQFKHGWECFTLWDIIMPLFIFMCGAAIPLALPKRMTDGRARWPYWSHVLKRVALLWVCGMVVQGNLLSLDPLKIGPFSNTLQAIAVGYAATAALMLLPRVWMRCAVTAALFAAYALLLHVGGDYTPEGNFTAIVERRVFAAVLPEGSIWLKVGYYTWIVPSIMFTAMTLCGFHATEILRSAFSPKRRAALMFAYAGALLAAGFTAAVWIPVIKPIYTVSFTLQAMGWSVLALAVLYVVTDIFAFRSYLAVPVLFGRHCLFAYMALHVPFKYGFDALANAVTAGFAVHFGKGVQSFWATVFVCCALVFAVKIRDALQKAEKSPS